jgi:hypothetical protein
MTPSTQPRLVTASKRLRTGDAPGFPATLTFAPPVGLSLDGDEWSMARTARSRCWPTRGGRASGSLQNV